MNRVIRNHNKLKSKNIDIDSIVMEQYALSNTDTILEICNKINSLENANNTTKYSLALENICYSLESNKKYYDINTVSELITEYFLYNGICESEEVISLLEKVSLKKKPNIGKIKDLLKRFPDEKIKSKSFIKSIITRFYSLSENNIIEETPNFLTWIRKGIVFSTLSINPYIGILNIFIDQFIEMTVKRSEIKKMISKLEQEKKNIEESKKKAKGTDLVKDLDKYMKEVDSNIEKLYDYEESLYSEKELEEKDDDFTLESTVNNLSFSKEEYLNEYHNLFINEINKAIDKCKQITNSSLSKYMKNKMFIIATEGELNQFRNIDSDSINEFMNMDNKITFPIAECLPYNHFSIKEHREETNGIFIQLIENINSILDDKVKVTLEGNIDKYILNVELDVTIDNIVQENSMNKELKKDFAMILAISEQVEKLSTKDIHSVFKNMREEFMNICEDDIEYLIVFNHKYNEIFDINIIKESLLDIRENIYNNCDSMKATKMGSIIQESIYQLSNRKENILRPKNRYEVLMETIEINQGLDILNELSLGNKVKIAQQNLVKNMKTLSDKEKVISRQMDNSLDKFYNKVEKELTNKNREKVIKGSILPSASSIVKLAIASGVVYMINPALAVITVLGSIAMSKNGTKKEKQYILDEINIMLKLVDKKIQLAENNNDMKALEQLLRTQQKLERERQRIQYNLRRRNYPVMRDNN